MSLQQLKDGRVIRIEHVEEHLVSQEDLQAMVNQLTAKLSNVNSLIQNSPTITIPGTDGSYTPPADPVQTTDPTPPVNETPAQPDAPVDTTATPVDQSQQVPVADPNQQVPAVADTTVVAADPNQVQPDQNVGLILS